MPTYTDDEERARRAEEEERERQEQYGSSGVYPQDERYYDKPGKAKQSRLSFAEIVFFIALAVFIVICFTYPVWIKWIKP